MKKVFGGCALAMMLGLFAAAPANADYTACITVPDGHGGTLTMCEVIHTDPHLPPPST